MVCICMENSNPYAYILAWLRNAFKAWRVGTGSTMKAGLMEYVPEIVEEHRKGKQLRLVRD